MDELKEMEMELEEKKSTNNHTKAMINLNINIYHSNLEAAYQIIMIKETLNYNPQVKEPIKELPLLKRFFLQPTV